MGFKEFSIAEATAPPRGRENAKCLSRPAAGTHGRKSSRIKQAGGQMFVVDPDAQCPIDGIPWTATSLRFPKHFW
ncbi:hypothetical protein Rcae01_00446 [Novipirellula caenicola]|uniref:Uncharacterized protein n=1 Tax=Novipirellula caenicola TaxID=1536901 RepID=A0ABP9VIG7_9BACT